jgi:tetratricopeptide (TPR) repeat protein
MSFNLIDTVTPLEIRIREYLEKEKNNKDRKIRKIADILIEGKMISYEVTNIHIKYLRKIKSMDPFETLLLALLLADLEEYTESIAVFKEFIQMAGNDPIIKEIEHYILLIKISEINDFSNIAQDALTLIRSISTEENIVTLLWRLGGIVEAKENPEMFLKLVDLGIELFPDQFRLNNFKAWIYKEQNHIDAAIAEYLRIVECLTQEPDNDYFNYEAASAYNSLAECYLLLPDPDTGKALDYCNLAQKHDEMTQESIIGNVVLLTRAKAFLLTKDLNEEQRNQILSDVNKVLENDPENEEGRAILQQINLYQPQK